MGELGEAAPRARALAERCFPDVSLALGHDFTSRGALTVGGLGGLGESWESRPVLGPED